jgi:hypothetical protein
LFADVKSGADDLESVNFLLAAGTTSSINSRDGIMYQTDCSDSSVRLPAGSDLRLEGTMRYYANGPSSIGLQINVVNIGNRPATAASGTVSVAGLQVTGALYQYFGGSATAPNTVNPGERGYIKVDLAAGTLAPCGHYPVHIDLGRTMQSGSPDPFANDSGQVATQCLAWTTPIDGDDLGVTPDPLIAGKTIEGIVSSEVSGRADGLLCSACHYAGSGHPYSPPVAAGGTAQIAPTDVIGGHTWAGPGGWADQFMAQTAIKPAHLRDMFNVWRTDGDH